MVLIRSIPEDSAAVAEPVDSLAVADQGLIKRKGNEGIEGGRT